MASKNNVKWWNESTRLKAKNKRRSKRRGNDLENAKKIYSDRSDAEAVKAYRNHPKRKQQQEAQADTLEVAQ